MVVIAAMVIAAAAHSAPVYVVQDSHAAVMAAVAIFREQQDVGAFEAMRDGGSPALKEEGAAAFVERMRAHSGRMGAFVSSVADVAMENQDSDGVTYTLLYKARYKKGSATERIDFRRVGTAFILEAFKVMDAQPGG